MNMQHAFRFGMNQRVRLNMSGESGVVIGAATFANHSDQYQVRYVASDGRQVEQWWDEDALSLEDALANDGE
jgi:hypothetical protein